jgi:hypothetical protein
VVVSETLCLEDQAVIVALHLLVEILLGIQVDTQPEGIHLLSAVRQEDIQPNALK